jgi:biotin carboxyl carrier protein
MTFDIEVGGRVRSVVVEPSGGSRFRITIDGEDHVVDARRVGDYGLSLIASGPSGASHEAQVVIGSGPGERLVWIDGRTVSAVVDGRRGPTARGERPGTGQGEQAILAPMPGRVVRVLAAAGDAVAARQAVVVVEAMKMENELRSPRAGRIKEVLVAEGTSVEAGRVLVVIEQQDTDHGRLP